MNDAAIQLRGLTLIPLPSGGLFLPVANLLCVSDLHLGKSDRIARRGGGLLPPYENRETLARIEADIDRTGARTVLCLGDSFDDPLAAEALDEEETLWLMRLQAGRRWLWVEGNHDPGPVGAGGTHLAEYREGQITFRHIAREGEIGEISGHYHPKAEIPVRGTRITRRCFLYDEARLIMPAYGTYTGGLRWTAPELRRLFGPRASAALLGDPIRTFPVPA